MTATIDPIIYAIPKTVKAVPATLPRTFTFFLNDIKTPIPNEAKNVNMVSMSRRADFSPIDVNANTAINISGMQMAKLIANGFIDNLTLLSFPNSRRSYNFMLYN